MPRGKRTYDINYFLEWIRNRNSNYIDWDNASIKREEHFTNKDFEKLIKAKDLKRFIRRVERLLAYTDPELHKKINKRKLPKKLIYVLNDDGLIIKDKEIPDGYRKAIKLQPDYVILRITDKNINKIIEFKTNPLYTKKHLKIVRKIIQ